MNRGRPRLLVLRDRLAAAQPSPKANKYRARKTECRLAHKHDSAREARRCNDLQMMERGGAISDLRYQPQFWFEIAGRVVKHPNGRRVGVTFDFTYVQGGVSVAEDSKGHRVRDWPLRRAIFSALYPQFEVRET